MSPNGCVCTKRIECHQTVLSTRTKYHQTVLIVLQGQSVTKPFSSYSKDKSVANPFSPYLKDKVVSPYSKDKKVLPNRSLCTERTKYHQAVLTVLQEQVATRLFAECSKRKEKKKKKKSVTQLYSVRGTVLCHCCSHILACENTLRTLSNKLSGSSPDRH